jgi:uncharacterized protein YjbJ (UPF0337 family)
MDWNRVEGNWKQVKGKVKEQWDKLTDDDLDRIAGKRDQFEARSRNATVWRRIAFVRMSTIGMVGRAGRGCRGSAIALSHGSVLLWPSEQR